MDNTIETDVAVIGGGLAGAVAAITASEQGRKSIVIKKSPGATALSSGGFDLAENPIQTKFDPPETFLSVSTNIREIIKRSPAHPYSIIAKERTDKDLVKLFLAGSQMLLNRIDPDSLQYAGLEESNDDIKNCYVVNQFGWVRPTGFVQKSMKGDDLYESKGARVLVVGVKGLSTFNPEFISRSVISLQEGLPFGSSTFERVDSCYVEFPGYEDQIGLSEFELAERLDDKAIAKDFIQRFENIKNIKEYSHIIVPSILGMRRSYTNWHKLEKSIGRRAIEAQPSSRSVPGLRLECAIEDVLKNKSIDVLRGRVSEYSKRQNRIGSIIVESKVNGELSKTTVRAHNFILATGRFIGGGIRKQKKMIETVFDLPIWTPYGEVGEFFIARLLGKRFQDSHAIFFCGLSIGPDMRPVDGRGKVIYENLHAAGSIIGGYDYVTGGCGFGIASMTGYLAGEAASQ